ncbi:hypothetical protein [Streptomyces acidiscabies]|uniref:hypothetical protein n=1 Tax=Streptomyces acidiscabies TaxID=42234 RepID=UPI0038F658B3
MRDLAAREEHPARGREVTDPQAPQGRRARLGEGRAQDVREVVRERPEAVQAQDVVQAAQQLAGALCQEIQGRAGVSAGQGFRTGRRAVPATGGAA